jgi:heptosyltransferase-1
MLHRMSRTLPRILLVKTSSLGDVVHNLPVVNDIREQFSDARIDWVVEESFAAIPCLHAGVGDVIPVALRRWRRGLLRAETRGECRAFLQRLREREYDAVVDTQGLLKSALVTCAARGQRYGLDWSSSREPLRLFYDRTFRVPWGQHAVVRNRSLAAQALSYALPAQTTYGIKAPQRTLTWLPATRYAVLLHATSADTKLWPEDHWAKLSKYLFLNNIISILPWGNAAECARSERLATTMSNAVVPPALGLEDMAALLAQAQVVVGVDTGLTHLAAALDLLTVGLYCATDPAATGIHACPRAVNLGGIAKPPAVHDVISALQRLGIA